MESHFKISDIRRGQKLRDYTLKDTQKYIREKAPKKYWDDLQPDFDIAAKRRVFDSGYYECLNSPKVELIQDDTVVTAKGHEVITKNGKHVPADVIVLCTVSIGRMFSHAHFDSSLTFSFCRASGYKIVSLTCPSALLVRSLTDRGLSFQTSSRSRSIRTACLSRTD